MSWIVLIIAGLFETAFAFSLGKFQQTTGTESKWWLLAFFVCLVISMVLLFKASQNLPIGTAYAVWTGIGAVGTVVLGILFLNESADLWRLFFIFMLISAIIGLKFTQS